MSNLAKNANQFKQIQYINAILKGYINTFDNVTTFYGNDTNGYNKLKAIMQLKLNEISQSYQNRKLLYQQITLKNDKLKQEISALKQQTESLYNQLLSKHNEAVLQSTTNNIETKEDIKQNELGMFV